MDLLSWRCAERAYQTHLGRGSFRALACGQWPGGWPPSVRLRPQPASVPITNDLAAINLELGQSVNPPRTRSLAVSSAVDFDQDGTNDVSGQSVIGNGRFSTWSSSN